MSRRQSFMDRRAMLLGTLALAGCSHASSSRHYAAVVGNGGYSSVQAALDAAPSHAAQPYPILVKRGRWREKLTLNKPNLHLVGEDRLGTVIDFDAAAGLASPDGAPWGTSRSATLTITAPDCALQNITIENSFDYVGARANPGSSPAGNGLQAVALAVANSADRTVVSNADLNGWQDTLLVNAGRSLFRNCAIRGAVDYIFGAGTAYFDRCEIITRVRASVSDARQGYIAAPSTLLSRAYGLVFENCRIQKAPGLAVGSIALGRPWRPTTGFADGRYGNPEAVGQAVFLNCWMDDHIDPQGWDGMAYGAKGGGRAWFKPEDARFFEFESFGPGGRPSQSRRQLTREQATRFALHAVLDEWRPA